MTSSRSAAAPSWMVRIDLRYCRPCGRDVTSRPRPRLAGLGVAAVVALVLAMIGFSALIGPFIMFTVPFILLAGFAIGPLVGLASAPSVCSICGRELLHRSRESLRSAQEAGRPRDGAHPAAGFRTGLS